MDCFFRLIARGATFGLTPSQYKKVKGLKSQNLRERMTDLELIFSMLGEASTTEIVKTQNPKGFAANKKAAKQGGSCRKCKTLT